MTAPDTQRCAACGASSEGAAHFCSSCGQPLPPKPPVEPAKVPAEPAEGAVLQAEPAPRTGSAATPVSRYVIRVLGVLTALVVLRAFLIFMGANAEQGLVALIYSLSEPFVTPFEGILPQPMVDTFVVPIDMGAMIAVIALQGLSALIRAAALRAAEVPA